MDKTKIISQQEWQKNYNPLYDREGKIREFLSRTVEEKETIQLADAIHVWSEVVTPNGNTQLVNGREETSLRFYLTFVPHQPSQKVIVV